MRALPILTVMAVPALLAVLAAVSCAAPPPAPPPAPSLLLVSPVACDIGVTCFIQQYVDHDLGSGASDYMCGHEVYNGHDGTDIRLPDKMAEMRGVAVVAAADGLVVNIRDGEPDWGVGAFDPAKVNMDKACGNRVVIKHANGWDTQYCHLRPGSVVVKEGQAVKAGTTLGLIGQSGDAEFVHLHFRLALYNQVVDPFASGQASCGKPAFMWAPAAAEQMAYRVRQVLNAGFAPAAVSDDDVERGGLAAPTRSSPALVVYVRTLALAAGDVQTLVLYGPDGREMARSVTPALSRDKAQYQMFVGKKLTEDAWPAGHYRGAFSIANGGKTVMAKDVSLILQ